MWRLDRNFDKKLNTQISPKSRFSFWDPTKCGCVAEIRCKEVWSSAFFFGVLAGSFWSSQEPHQKVEADAGDVELGQLGKDAISDGSSRDSCESRERLLTTRTANDWILVACLMGDTERLSIQSRWTNWSSLSKGPSGFCPWLRGCCWALWNSTGSLRLMATGYLDAPKRTTIEKAVANWESPPSAHFMDFSPGVENSWVNASCDSQLLAEMMEGERRAVFTCKKNQIVKVEQYLDCTRKKSWKVKIR